MAIVEATLTDAWGISPGSATLLVKGDYAPTKSEVTVSIGGKTFYGIVQSNVASARFDTGDYRDVALVDRRDYLNGEVVFGYWNKVIEFEDDPTVPGIKKVRKFEHLIPTNFRLQKKTWTDRPATAEEIITNILASPTVRYDWSFTSAPQLGKARPLNIDASNGKDLAALLQEILDKVGMVVCLSGAHSLRFAVKGSGGIPSIPVGAKEYGRGTAMTDYPTKVTIVGDRNLYQVANLQLEPDWIREWEQFWFEPAWFKKVEEMFGPFPKTKAGRAELAAKARKVTLREAAEKLGAAYVDNGRYGQTSRMETAAWDYIQGIVWRAYRIPRDYQFKLPDGTDVSLASLEIAESLLNNMRYDPRTGKHAVGTEPQDLYPNARAFITAQGQPIDFYDPSRAGGFDPHLLSSIRDTWSLLSDFEVDERNKFFLFGSQVFIPGEDNKGLFIFPNQGVKGIPEELLHVCVPNADAVLSPAAPLATVCFKGDRYGLAKGNGKRHRSYYQGGLCRHMVGFKGELTYQDGERADKKAEELAATLLERDETIPVGGYERVGVAGTELAPNISRVTATLNFEGVSERVEFAKERRVLSWESEYELDRRKGLSELYPGQEAAREEARKLQLLSQIFKTGEKNKETYYRTAGAAGNRPTTDKAASPKIVYDGESGLARKAGDVLWKNDKGQISPAGSSLMGVVVAQDNAAPNINVVDTGIVPVRVQGPFADGEIVGCEDESTVAYSGGRKQIGVVQGTYSGAEIVLAPVRIVPLGLVARRPWQPYAGTAPNKIKIRHGVVHGTIVPSNMGDEFTLSGGENHFYVKLSLGSGGKVVTGAQIVKGNFTNPATVDTPPTTLYQKIFVISTTEQGGASWGSVVQVTQEPFDVAAYVAEIDGDFPSPTVKTAVCIILGGTS